jgi:hypothetical protein
MDNHDLEDRNLNINRPGQGQNLSDCCPSEQLFVTHFNILNKLDKPNFDYSKQLFSNNRDNLKQLITIDYEFMGLLCETSRELMKQKHSNYIQKFDYWIRIKYRELNLWFADNPEMHQETAYLTLRKWFEKDLEDADNWLSTSLLERNRMLEVNFNIAGLLFVINMDIPKQLLPITTDQWLDTNIEFRLNMLQTNHAILKQLFPNSEYAD